MKKKEVVFVGMSGGVDSAVSAALLLKQGYDVVGVFIKTWHPEFLSCNEEEEKHDAMRVAAHLNIPFLTFDLEKEYKKEVADYMIAEYKAGRTPNPDVMCNKYVKFGGFLKKAVSMGADYVATGHYTRLRKFSKNSPLYPQAGSDTDSILLNLLRSSDENKDQSYFLWTLRQDQLKRILFPVGNLNKTEVRKLAKKFNLPVSVKKDSQGICFLGAIDLKQFLKHYIKEKRGKVLNTSGEVIGYHNGVVFHTLGERHGFTITKKSSEDRPYYVVAKDFKKNILIVSQEKNSPNSNILSIYTLTNINWINEAPKEEKDYTAQVRYHGSFLSCRLKLSSKTKVEIIFKSPVLVDSGQSCVIYDKDICMGGGIVN